MAMIVSMPLLYLIYRVFFATFGNSFLNVACELLAPKSFALAFQCSIISGAGLGCFGFSALDR